MSDSPRQLTEKQAKYLEGIGMGLSKRQSAKRAGYGDHGAIVGIENSPALKAALAEMRQKVIKKAVFTKTDVLNGLKKAIDQADIQADPQSQISGWREVGRMLGFYEPEKREIRVSGQVEHFQKELEQMSDSDLAALIDENHVIEGDYEEIEEDGGDESAESETLTGSCEECHEPGAREDT
jgi:phage terminase small subunit